MLDYLHSPNFLYYVLGAGALHKIMARKNKYRVDEVLRSLSKKHDVRINGTDILVLNGKSKKKPKQHDLGNGSWGKIDYLVNYCGYRQYFVAEF